MLKTSREENYEHVLMCLICRSLFDDHDHQPKFLPCHHTFCKDCLREYVQQMGDEIECPSCRKLANIPAAGVAALQTNFYVKYIQSLVSGSGSNYNGEKGFCSVHNTKKVQLYCKNCEMAICDECSDSCYPHSKISITTITEESHLKLDSSFSSANSTIENKKMKIENLLKGMSVEKDQALKKIDSSFEQSVHILNRRATLLKNKVIDIYKENVEKLEADMEEIATAFTCIASLKDYYENKISHACFEDIAKGIEDIKDVQKNINNNIKPCENHIMYEEEHGSDRFKASIKDLGRVRATKPMHPRTEPEGNDADTTIVQHDSPQQMQYYENNNDTPSPKDETLFWKEETPSLKEETPSWKEETPSSKEETPSPKEETPSPKEETPSPKEETPFPKEESLILRKEPQTLKKEPQTLKKEPQTLKKETQTLKKEIPTMKEETPTLKKEIQTLKKETQTLKKETQTLKEDKVQEKENFGDKDKPRKSEIENIMKRSSQNVEKIISVEKDKLSRSASPSDLKAGCSFIPRLGKSPRQNMNSNIKPIQQNSLLMKNAKNKRNSRGSYGNSQIGQGNKISKLVKPTPPSHLALNHVHIDPNANDPDDDDEDLTEFNYKESINGNTSPQLRVEKTYYQVVYTSYDEEELLNEIKQGNFSFDDSDSWQTMSSSEDGPPPEYTIKEKDEHIAF